MIEFTFHEDEKNGEREDRDKEIVRNLRRSPQKTRPHLNRDGEREGFTRTLRLFRFPVLALAIVNCKGHVCRARQLCPSSPKAV